MATLEEALAGTRRGERWERGGSRLRINADGDREWVEEGLCLCPSPDGWTRVEEPLLCPRCGMTVCIVKPKAGTVVNFYATACVSCMLTDGNHYPTEAEAREAWLKIGMKP